MLIQSNEVLNTKRELRRIVDGKAMKHNFPLQVTIQLLKQCHMRCSFCYVAHESPSVLSLEILSQLFADLYQMRTMLITLTGGEIFLRKDLEQILKILADYKFGVSIQTTAMHITSEWAEKLKFYRVSYVFVSLYSHIPEHHDELTKRKGSFEKTLLGIKNLLQAGIKTSISCLVTKININDLEGIEVLAKDLNVPISFSHEIKEHELKEKDYFSLEINHEEKRKVEIFKYKHQKKQLIQLLIPDARVCGAGNSSLRIEANGDVLPCVAWRVSCGNLTRNSIVDIWYQNEYLKELRQKRVKDLILPENTEATSQLHHCPGYSFEKTGNYLKVLTK